MLLNEQVRVSNTENTTATQPPRRTQQRTRFVRNANSLRGTNTNQPFRRRFGQSFRDKGSAIRENVRERQKRLHVSLS
jgi:hypothetical protein